MRVEFRAGPMHGERSEDIQRGIRTVEQQRVFESTLYRFDPLCQSKHGFPLEERVAGDAPGARAMKRENVSVENSGRPVAHFVRLEQMNSGMERLIRGGVKRALDLLFPPQCIACRAHIWDEGSLCSACWQKIRFLDGPGCACCGLPFALDPGAGTLCATCHASPPAFDKARAVMRYDEQSRGPILALKHADRLDLTPAFGRWLRRGGRDLLADTDIIVPVPLHARRLWSRRYNQSAELSRALGRLTGKPVNFEVLIRARHTPSQGEMPSPRARRRNMQGAFRVPDGHKSAVTGRNALLVDDVLTTGATVEACARALKRAGAAKVFVLALARVVRPLASDII